ncbi:hypothetical protein Hamer_G000437, partial [Homarus americanus]
MSEDIDEVLASHTEELTNKDSEFLAEKAAMMKTITLTLKYMSLAFSRLEEGLDMLAEDDSKREHNSKMHQNVLENL